MAGLSAVQARLSIRNEYEYPSGTPVYHYRLVFSREYSVVEASFVFSYEHTQPIAGIKAAIILGLLTP